MEILAYSYRGPLKDLSYTGSVAVVNSEGKLLYYAGDPQKVAYLRSSAKPMQAMCALESGAVDAYRIDRRGIGSALQLSQRGRVSCKGHPKHFGKSRVG